MTDSPYDVIVVGGGTSGSVVAARLSEDPGRRVLLLEAGAVFTSVAEFPPQLLGRDESAWVGQDHNWRYSVRLTRDRPEPVPVTRGRVIGGSSSVNGGIHVRAVPEDFSGWGDGCWDWPDVLHAYRTSERDLDFGADPVHGDRGPVTVRRAGRPDYTSLYAAFDAACRSLGYPECADLNHPQAAGVGPLPRNFEHGVRANAAFAYVLPALGRANLDVRGESVVDRVLIEHGIVGGVQCVENGQLVRWRAPEVVLCAGALMTPAVLLRSGIGPPADLAALGLPAAVPLPGVGAALRDHPTVHVQVRPRSESVIPAEGAPGRLQAALTFTAPGSPDRNDLQIMPSYRGDRLALTVMLNRSFSAGTVRLSSADPRDGPRIELNYLARADDRARLRAGVEEAVRIMTAPALAAISERGGRELRGLRPGEPGWLDGQVSTAAHSAGSCPIGDPDLGGVVDACGRVHGVDGLSVADVSIVPVPLRNNTNATAFMIGERFAELYDLAPVSSRPDRPLTT
jgi:choline dehydrogenase